MNKTIFVIGIIAAIISFVPSRICANPIETTTTAQEDVRNNNYKVYVVLGNYDLSLPAPPKKNIIVGRGNTRSKTTKTSKATKAPKVNNQRNETRNEPRYKDDVLDAIEEGIGSARRVITRKIQNQTDLNSLINSTQKDVYVLNGVITRLESEIKFQGSGKEPSSSHATISLTYKLVDARTGNVLKTFSTISSGSSYTRPTVHEAMEEALKYVSSNVAYRLNTIFPICGEVIEIYTVNKDKAKTLYINLGTADNIAPGALFKVFAIEMVGGKEVYKKIGKVKVLDEQGAEASKCKVTSGGKDILQAVESGRALIVESYN